MKVKQKNSKKQGDVGLGAAIGHYCSLGITVCVPLTDSQEYDLVIDTDGLKRVQVKTATKKARTSGCYEVELRTKGGNKSGTGKTKLFDASKVDVVFVLTEDWRKYSIPSSIIKGKSCMTVGGDNYKEFLVNSPKFLRGE